MKTFDEQMQANSAPELDEALGRDPLRVEYRRDVDELELAYGDFVSTVGAQHPQSLKLKRRLDAMNQKLTDRESDVKSRTAELLRANLTNDMDSAQAALYRVNHRIAELRREVSGQ